jgi:HNH endonuclease
VPPRQYAALARGANHQCEYCLAPEEFFNSSFEVEHLVPSGRGGGNDIDNLALACRDCNGSKLARLVFRLADDGVEIAGKTAVGRATAVHLHMNSAKAVEARTLWFDFFSR